MQSKNPCGFLILAVRMNHSDPAAVASPSLDIDVIPAREITQFVSNLDRRIQCAPSHYGGLVAQEGGFIQKKRFSIENCIKKM
jgi:hypothetical protein